MKTTFAQLKEIISQEKADAEFEARGWYPIVRSRGNRVSAFGVDDGGIELDKLTKKEVVDAVNYYLGKGCKDIVIDGGFDGADSIVNYWDTYAAGISEWCVNIVKDGEWLNEYN